LDILGVQQSSIARALLSSQLLNLYEKQFFNKMEAMISNRSLPKTVSFLSNSRAMQCTLVLIRNGGRGWKLTPTCPAGHASRRDFLFSKAGCFSLAQSSGLLENWGTGKGDL
jgi:hypothetical protein